MSSKQIEVVRERTRKASLGQFFTSASVARFMASMFQGRGLKICQVLDAGAGEGSLARAFLERFKSGDFEFPRVDVDAFEIDDFVASRLESSLEEFSKLPEVTVNVRNEDFVHVAARSLSGDMFARELPKYTHAILNPPYRKIRSDSSYRRALREVGIETVNLYSGFVGLALLLLEHGGQLVAIIPRSFCNGPYYRDFRKMILRHSAIRRLHLFKSRSSAFKRDGVLQENVIIMLERGCRQGDVEVSTSTDDAFSDMESNVYGFDSIVFPDDSERFIHVPTSPDAGWFECGVHQMFRLSEVGIDVSTGPVVDFRNKDHLRSQPEAETVPLLYPAHFPGLRVVWPNYLTKKPNAIVQSDATEKWLYPCGYYCVVRRFSSKEERRRICASVVSPDDFPESKMLAFENHLNVFHEKKCSMPKLLAFGLAAYLNTSVVDDSFRRFNGHTQVNATDLRLMKYPDRKQLMEIGGWVLKNEAASQEEVEQGVMAILNG